MATTTSNLGLTKPAYADTADIEVINENMDTLDAAVNGVEGGLAIISNNNTHAAISAGQFVYVRKHGTLAEGLYKARSNIAANATLSTANLETVSGGLGAEVSALSDQTARIYFGSSSNSLKTNLENNWTSSVPNDSIRFVQITSQYGDFYGYLSRYSNNYGSGVLTRYDGTSVVVTLSAGTVTVYNITKAQ